MAITINSDRITIGSKNIVIVPNGIMIEHGTFYAPELSAGQVRGVLGVQGTVAGYVVGGSASPNSPLTTGAQTVERYPFATDTNATQLPGVLYQDSTPIGGWRAINSAVSSSSHGYHFGGNSQPANSSLDTIGRFPFANSWSTGSNVGTLTSPRERNPATASTQNYGYAFGGLDASLPGGGQSVTKIERFPFTAETTNSTLVGALTRGAMWGTIAQTADKAYHSCGLVPGASDYFERYALASEFGNSLLIGNFPTGTYGATGHSSTTSGYHIGGIRGGGFFPDRTAYIYKYPFATEAISNIGSVPTVRIYGSGSSSTVSGYIAGGSNSAPPGAPQLSNTIVKFPFATDTTYTSVGTLSRDRAYSGGAQY